MREEALRKAEKDGKITEMIPEEEVDSSKEEKTITDIEEP